jgi:transcriptional regulator with XRE-family HTH domain
MKRMIREEMLTELVCYATFISGSRNLGEDIRMTFGQFIAEARKKARLSQKELAARITKEDGQPISPQYLNDIEHDRRNPPSEFILQQLARVLKVELDILNYYAGRLPSDLREREADPQKVAAAYRAFRRELKGN